MKTSDNVKSEDWRTSTYGVSLPQGRQGGFTTALSDGSRYSLSKEHGLGCTVGYKPIETTKQPTLLVLDSA